MNKQSVELDSTVKGLLLDAAEWRLIGLLFECPSEAWNAQIATLSEEIEDAELKTATEAAQIEASEGLYHSIFGPGGPAPPREISYSRSMQPGYLIAELLSYYDAFSYSPTAGEAPDHISFETNFIGYLRLKEAYALVDSDPEHAKLTAESARRFIEDHLATFAEPMAVALQDSGIRYLEIAGASLLKRVGPKRGLPILDDCASPSCEDENVFGCGE